MRRFQGCDYFFRLITAGSVFPPDSIQQLCGSVRIFNEAFASVPFQTEQDSGRAS